MSVESLQPVPLDVFGTWLTLLDPSDVPPGMSPDLRDIEFFPGGVRTRPGLVSAFTPLSGSPKINGLKSFITKNLVQRFLVFDSLGNLYKEISPGTLALVASGLVQASYMASTTLFGREYMGFSDGLVGQDLPRQFDDTYFDRVSQVGPGEGPTEADAPDAGSISPGAHQCVVVFVTRQGYWTAPSPPVTWTAAGSKKVNVTSIPVGPSNVVQRLLAFTAAGGASFYHVPATMVINDNATTSLEVDFSDTVLLSGVSMNYLFGQIELPDQLNVKSLLHLLNMSMPRNLIQVSCRHTLYDPGCTLSRSAFQTSGSITAGSNFQTLNTNLTQAGPLGAPASAPTLSSVGGHAIPAQTYYVVVTYVDANGESLPSAESSLVVAKNNRLQVASPASVTGATGWNCYVGNISGGEVLQNQSAIAIGTNFTLPDYQQAPVLGVPPPAIAESGYFALGVITFTSGINNGLSATIATYGVGATGQIVLMAPVPNAPATGDTFTIVPGCDKKMTTCNQKFSNLIHFGGEPFVPQPETAL